MIDIAVSLDYSMQMSLLWIPQENLSWYLILNIFRKLVSAIKS